MTKSKNWTDEQLDDIRRRYVLRGESIGSIIEAYPMTRGAFAGLSARQGWSAGRDPGFKALNNRKVTTEAPLKEVTLPAERRVSAHLAVDGPQQNPVFSGITRCMWPGLTVPCKEPPERGAYCKAHGARAYVGRPPRGFRPKEAAQ